MSSNSAASSTDGWPTLRTRTCVTEPRSLEVVGGTGQFEAASGRIVSNFVVSDTGDLTDNQLGLVFLRVTLGGMDRAREALEDLAANPDVTVTIGAGSDGWENGATTLKLQGDGRVEVQNLAGGKERKFEGRLDAPRVEELGRDLARLGLTSLEPQPGQRRPGDAPVWVAVERGGEALHEARLWHGDRFADPGLDGVLDHYQRLVEQVTGGKLPFGEG